MILIILKEGANHKSKKPYVKLMTLETLNDLYTNNTIMEPKIFCRLHPQMAISCSFIYFNNNIKMYVHYCEKLVCVTYLK
jgi:hypothetical protein